MKEEMYCDRCKTKKFDIQEPHILMSFMRDNQNIKEGKRIWLCKKCHDIIHKCLTKIVWEYVDKKEDCKNAVKEFTEEWIKEG